MGDATRTRTDCSETRPGNETPEEASRPVPPASPARTSIPAAGELIGRFIVISKLGSGGMGVVLLAYDPALQRNVAVKLIRTDFGSGLRAEAGTARLLREAQAMAQIAHPNVVAVYDVGQVGEQVFIAMEHVDGETLTDWLLRPR